MKKYNIFHPYLMSFFSPNLYRDVGRNWKGIGALYLLLLLAICWLPTTWQMHGNLKQFIQQEAPKVIEQVPTITLKNGVASIDKPTPYTIKDETGKPVIIFDMTERYKSVQDTEAMVLITAKEVSVRNKENEIRTYELSSLPDTTIGQPQLIKILDTVSRWAIAVVFIVMLLLSFCYRIVQALIYGAIGVVFAKIVKASLSFQQCVRLAIIAVTPVIILSTIFDYFAVHFPYQFFLYFVITMGYLFFAVKANKRLEQEVAPVDAS